CLSPRSTSRLHACVVGVYMAASIPPGAKMEQDGGCTGDSALQLGEPGDSLGSGQFLRIVSSGVFGITSRALKGGLEFIRFARLSWRSLWIPKAARTAQRPVPVGSHAMPTRGCQSAMALFSINADLPTFGWVRMNPARS